MTTGMGKVSLVGAGPGDPGLLTLKAQKRIQEADLIIYDYLANPEHLRHAKEAAVKICVGKGFRHRHYSQEKIRRLIIRAVRKGQHVVRLKGGDPYLFGRGGEEALFLYEHKIPFEVVPGVTSATACAAYAGIPLTHREHNASVSFITGHRAHDSHLDTVPWEKLVALKGTLVIYMGFYNLAKIAERLITHGMPARTRTCVIEWGTLPRQKSCDGTLSDIAKKVTEMKMKAPCIIIIGDVVRLRKKLNWYETLPLFGKKIVITRTREKGEALMDKLEELGAQVLEFPVIEIKEPSDISSMDKAIKKLNEFDWLIFTSTYGVDFFFNRLACVHKKDARALNGIKVACVGPGTEQALNKRGVFSDLIPKHFETEAISREFRKRFGNLNGKNVLLLRTNIAPPELDLNLKKLGAHVTRVTAYQTHLPKSISTPVKKKLLNGEAHCVTFTSSSTVTNFVKILGLKNVKKIAKSTKFASIGPVTSKTMREFGLKPSMQAKVYTIEGLVEAIKNYDGCGLYRMNSTIRLGAWKRVFGSVAVKQKLMGCI